MRVNGAKSGRAKASITWAPNDTCTVIVTKRHPNGTIKAFRQIANVCCFELMGVIDRKGLKEGNPKRAARQGPGKRSGPAARPLIPPTPGGPFS